MPPLPNSNTLMPAQFSAPITDIATKPAANPKPALCLNIPTPIPKEAPAIKGSKEPFCFTSGSNTNLAAHIVAPTRAPPIAHLAALV